MVGSPRLVAVTMVRKASMLSCWETKRKKKVFDDQLENIWGKKGGRNIDQRDGGIGHIEIVNKRLCVTTE